LKYYPQCKVGEPEKRKRIKLPPGERPIGYRAGGIKKNLI
jgi:hypothetical protein